MFQKMGCISSLRGEKKDHELAEYILANCLLIYSFRHLHSTLPVGINGIKRQQIIVYRVFKLLTVLNLF